MTMRQSTSLSKIYFTVYWCVCVCVCVRYAVCVRKRATDRDRGVQRERAHKTCTYKHTRTHTHIHTAQSNEYWIYRSLSRSVLTFQYQMLTD